MIEIIITSILLFFVAALFEIGGSYLVYEWIRKRKRLFLGLMGGIVLFLYGMVQTLQFASFGRVYAAYGGIFVISTLIWGAVISDEKPDIQDIVGMSVILFGVVIILFSPR